MFARNFTENIGQGRAESYPGNDFSLSPIFITFNMLTDLILPEGSTTLWGL